MKISWLSICDLFITFLCSCIRPMCSLFVVFPIDPSWKVSHIKLSVSLLYLFLSFHLTTVCSTSLIRTFTSTQLILLPRELFANEKKTINFYIIFSSSKQQSLHLQWLGVARCMWSNFLDCWTWCCACGFEHQFNTSSSE